MHNINFVNKANFVKVYYNFVFFEMFSVVAKKALLNFMFNSNYLARFGFLHSMKQLIKKC